MATQNDTEFHELFIMLRDVDDYYPKEDRVELLDKIKSMYEKYQDLSETKDSSGKYGIKYTTIHEDSRWSDHHEQFFSTKAKRDKVFEDWEKGFYWDDIFETELEYRTPSPNFGNSKKIFKEGKKTYEE